jgi:menaquinone-dependent protoporphyrinogen oxidase
MTETERLSPAAPPGGGPSVLVVYATLHGATRGVAECIAAALEREGVRVALRCVQDVGDPASYDAVVLGSPVYDQRWREEASAFVNRHRFALAGRPVWLFSVGTFGDTRRLIGPLVRREPRDIRALRAAVHARDYRVFAGVIERRRWPLLSRLFFHALGGRLGDNRDWAEIDRWACGIARMVGSEQR